MSYRLTMDIVKQDDRLPSPIVFRLDPRSGVPPYLQLVHQVEHALRLGVLRIGDQLPRLKDVVSSLSINPNTVQKAYRELEHKGIASGRPGQGTFIDAAPETVGLETLNTLRKKLQRGWLTDAAHAGLDEDAIVALFMSVLQDWRDEARKDGRAPQEGIA